MKKKQEWRLIGRNNKPLAEVAGFEPTVQESKSCVLPLDDTPLYYFYSLRLLWLAENRKPQGEVKAKRKGDKTKEQNQPRTGRDYPQKTE